MLSETQVERAERLLGVDARAAASQVPNGFDPETFARARRPPRTGAAPRRRAAGLGAGRQPARRYEAT